MNTTYTKHLQPIVLLLLMLLPVKATANDVVETFQGRSHIEKGQMGSQYYASQTATLSAKFQYTLSGGNLKLVEEEQQDNYLKRTYTGTIYRGQEFNVNLKCLHSEGDLIEDSHTSLWIQELENRIHHNMTESRFGELPRDANVSFIPDEYTDKAKFRLYCAFAYYDATHEDLPLKVWMEIIVEVKVVGVAQKDAVYIEDNNAREEPGGDPWPYVIPGSVVAALLGYSLTRKSKGGSQDNNNQQNDLADRYEMRIYKTFGDTLLVGAMPQQVYASIVGIKNGAEYTDMNLTSLISFCGDNYITAQDAGMRDGWHCVNVQAVNMPGPYEDGVVTFILDAGTGLYNNRLHFKIQEGEMHFAQENLTLPAHYDKEVRLPFVIDGMDDDAHVTAVVKDQNGNVSDMYEVRVEWNAQKEVQEAIIIDKMRDKEKDCHTPGHFIDFILHLEAINDKKFTVKCDYPLVRFYMGMVYDIGVGYEGYEVGCYLEEYNQQKHTRKLIWGESAGKTYVPAETLGYLRIYDYDEANHCIMIVSPVPNPKSFSIKAIDETEQQRVDKLGLNYEAKDTGHPRGTRIILRCLKGLLDAPSRIDAVVTFSSKYKEKEYTCETQVLLCSQPRRILKDAAAWDALIKEDRRLLQNIERIESHIVNMGVEERLMPLVKYIHIVKDGYLEDYGVDRESAKLIARVHAYMMSVASDYTFDEGYKPLTLAGEIAQWFKDYAQAMITTAQQVNQYLAVPVMIARIALGIKTMGASEGFFRLYDAFSIGLTEISMAELYVEKGKDAVIEQMKVMAIEAVKWQIFTMGMKVCFIVATTPVGGQPPLSTRASTTKAKPRQLPKSSTKKYSSGKKGSASKQVIEESNRRQQMARDEVRSPGARAKSKGRKPKKSLKNGIDQGRIKAKCDIDDLEAIVRRCESNPSPENLQKLRVAVLNVQSNKQAMYRLKALGEQYDGVRKAFNLEMLKIYEETDLEVMYELAARHHLSLDRIGRGNVSMNKLDDLRSGKTITFDRDTHYYYIDDKGNKIFFSQKATQQLYNRCFHERATGYQAGSQEVADYFTKAMDGTVIEDAIHHPESFGKEDIKILTDNTQHYKPLNNAKQVRDTIIYKTEERLAEGDMLYAKAQTILDPKRRADMEAKAVNAYMEGNRQTMKDFKNFVKPYDDARADINGRSYVTDNMRKAVEEIELLFDADNPIDIDELNVKLADRGYTAQTLVHDIADAMYRAGGGQ